MKKKDILLYLSILIFAAAGIYLLFFTGNTNKFDSTVKADRIDVHERTDSDGAILYYPTYVFTVDGTEYECDSNSGSSIAPNEEKNIVYYDSKDPNKCVTEYEKTSGIFGGIICIVVAIVIFVVSRKDFTPVEPPITNNEPRQLTEVDYKVQEKLEKAINIMGKLDLIVKRVVLGIVIIVLLLLIVFDSLLLKQTIKAKDYIETTAIYKETIQKEDNSDIVDLIYTFEDKNGNTQDFTITSSNTYDYQEEIKVKYNENDPSDFYEEGAVLNKSGIIWFVVKIIILILLIVLFFNKKWLSYINISFRKN